MSIAEKLATIAKNEQRVYDAGKAKRDYEWWSNYQLSFFGSEQVEWRYAFAGMCWSDATYNPIYDITILISSTDMYAYSAITDTKVAITGGSNAAKTFRNSNLCTIRKFIVDEGTPMNEQFTNCDSLENITIEGTIGKTANFQWCERLTPESMISIITHLKNFTTDDPDKAFTCSVQFHEDCWDNLVKNGGLSPNGNSWADYITDLGWNY